MATSNSYNFYVTRDNLITDALLQIGVIAVGETPSTDTVTEAARMLNMLVKLRAADGMPLSALKRATILPVTGTSSVTTISHIVSDYLETTISADEAASQSVISITSSTGMTSSDQIGIELDDGTMHWTTIVSVDSGTQVTITSSLASASSSGNKIYTYTASTARIARPLRVIFANVLNTTSDSSWELQIEDRETYYSRGNRTTASTPTALYYEPGLGTSSADPSSATTWYGTFFVYPRFNDGDHVIEFTYQRPFQDFDSSTDTPDFPQEFYLPLVLELAALLGPKYGVELKERQLLFLEAKMYRDEALSTIVPEGSLFLQPNDDR